MTCIFDDAEEYHIGGHFLSALINADYSGLGTDECAQFEAWETETRNGRSGHFSYITNYGNDFRRCDVTGKMAMCERVEFHPIKERVI